MLKFVKSFVAVAALVGLGLVSPAMAQSASEMAVRMQQLEEQVRQLTGRVQELSFEVNQLRVAGAAAPRQNGAGLALKPAASLAAAAPQPAPPPQPSQQKRLAAASAGAPIPDSNGVETIEQAPLGAPASVPMPPATMPPAAMPEASSAETVQQDVPGAAPAARVFGALDNAAAQPNDGGFQGQVLVPPSQQEPGDDYGKQGAAAQPATNDDSIETVSLQPGAATQTETPESLYERSNESLLRRQYGDAEAGFSTFLSQYPDHSLAGSAQYWLGETYYAQNDYKRAAAIFLQGYKKYPASRRAPDSLLKLGMSLNRLGQGEQACAALAAVSTEYPKAVDARKRAQSEARRVGCAS
ncbi:tol-pal system protein YbgF [Aestuariivirga sp.]|uniref:tol-pal system protein YbgF n=1 Tax=Aestuariivirga sp. TaxID=2650926 RepID=UPI0025C05CC7|nr:tol-pal system protein YbgF [Aestuariivirga sp.]MCA3556610.1 tol-pal system protein YbgF [Aestuariivirga sp.]